MRRDGCTPEVACRGIAGSDALEGLAEVGMFAELARCSGSAEREERMRLARARVPEISAALKAVKADTLIRLYREAMAAKGNAIRAEAELWARKVLRGGEERSRLFEPSFPDDLVPDGLLDTYPPKKPPRGRPKKPVENFTS